MPNFDELSEEGRNRAINDYVTAILELVPYEHHPWKDAIDEMERMQTPWFIGERVWELHQGDIHDCLREDYEYLSNGDIWAEV